MSTTYEPRPIADASRRNLTPAEKQALDDWLPEDLPDDSTIPERRSARSSATWNRNQWRAAAMRARGFTWFHISDYIGTSVNTLQKYVNINGFLDLVEWWEEWWFVARRDAWVREESDKVYSALQGGLDVVLSVLIDGEDPKTKRPIPIMERAEFALRFMKVVGYEEARHLLARQDARTQAFLDHEADDGADDFEIDSRFEAIDVG